MKPLILGCLLLAMIPAHAELYHWTDANGKKHYSDTPPADTDAEKLDVTPPPKIGQGEEVQRINQRLEQMREEEAEKNMTPEERLEKALREKALEEEKALQDKFSKKH